MAKVKKKAKCLRSERWWAVKSPEIGFVRLVYWRADADRKYYEALGQTVVRVRVTELPAKKAGGGSKKNG